MQQYDVRQIDRKIRKDVNKGTFCRNLGNNETYQMHVWITRAKL